MKLAVFGKTGQVAQAIAQTAKDRHAVWNADRQAADFTKPDEVARIAEGLEADAIINATAYTAVDQAESDAETAFLVNAESVGRLAEAAAARDIPLIHISTDYVFDGSGTHPRRTDELPSPLGVYGKSKYAGELALQAAGGRSVILRTSWVFSENGSNFVKTMLRLAETRTSLEIVSDQIGGPTAAASIADATIRLAERLAAGAPAGVYHYSGSPDVSWANFAREVFRQAGRSMHVNDIRTTDYPTAAPRPLNSRLDCESLEADHGIARPNWKQDLALVLKELQQ